jgi:transposase
MPQSMPDRTQDRNRPPKRGKLTIVRRRLSRGRLLDVFAQLPPCRIGMEACASARIIGLANSCASDMTWLIPPQYVKPYVKRNKTDAADAEAICEAVSRPNMRFVPIKTVEQQAVLALHRASSCWCGSERSSPTRSGVCWGSSGSWCPKASGA